MNIIIYGTNHNNTLGLVRSCGEKGHRVTLLLKKGKIDYVDKSRYIKKCIYLTPNTDVIATIKEVASLSAEKPILFSAGDAEATLVDAHIEELRPHVILEGGLENNAINKYRDKEKSNKLAQQIGFNLPKTWIVEDSQQLPKEKIFPIIVKANNSTQGGKAIQRICHNQIELSEQLNNIPSNNYPIQIQEFIDKEFEIMLQGCAMNHGERIFCRVANRKVRFYPHVYSAGSYSYSINIEDDKGLMELREKVSIYLKEIHYQGLFSAEFLFSKGKYYFLEVNLRNDGTAYLSTACGCNLANAFCNFIAANRIGIANYRPCTYMDARADFHHVRNGKVKFWTWLGQFLTAGCYSHFNWRDLRPFFYYILK